MSDAQGALLLVMLVLGPIIVFVVDVLTEQGYEVWVLYLPAILGAVWTQSPRRVVWVGVACSGLVIAGGCFSPTGEASVWLDVLNRGMGLLALWMMVFAGLIITRRSAQLADVVLSLRLEAVQHHRARGALAQSEERLRLAVDGAGMGTWDVNLLTGQAIWSDSLFRMLGYEPAPGGQASLALWQARVHPEDRSRAHEAREHARLQRSLYSAEYRVIRADNQEVVWLAVFGRFLDSPAGVPARFVGVAFNITHRKKLERDLMEVALREQRRIGQELHDGVGQALTGLGLMANALLQLLTEGTRKREIAGRLVAELDRAHQQVRALSAGLIPVQVAPGGLRAALEDLAAWAADQSGLPVTFSCQGEAEGSDHATATELFRIATEAINNALRHARAARIAITLTSDPDGLRLSVRDDGVGPDQVDESKGNGLRIMQYRADQIGGTLHVGPAEGAGTVVTCWLPGRRSHGEEGVRPVDAAGEGPDRR